MHGQRPGDAAHQRPQLRLLGSRQPQGVEVQWVDARLAQPDAQGVRVEGRQLADPVQQLDVALQALALAREEVRDLVDRDLAGATAAVPEQLDPGLQPMILDQLGAGERTVGDRQDRQPQGMDRVPVVVGDRRGRQSRIRHLLPHPRPGTSLGAVA